MKQSPRCVQSMAAEAGFDLKIRVVEFATAFKEAQAGNFQIFQIAWSGRVDPDANVYVFMHSKAPQNDGGYSNPEADKLMKTRAWLPTRQNARQSTKSLPRYCSPICRSSTSIIARS